MRFLVTTAITVLFASHFAFASEDLGQIMKSVNGDFKTLTKTVEKGTFVPEDLNDIESLQWNLSSASLLYPEKAQTAEDKVQYLEWMTQIQNLALQLEVTVEGELEKSIQDASSAETLLDEMNEIRKLAHNKFK